MPLRLARGHIKRDKQTGVGNDSQQVQVLVSQVEVKGFPKIGKGFVERRPLSDDGDLKTLRDELPLAFHHDRMDRLTRGYGCQFVLGGCFGGLGRSSLAVAGLYLV